MGSFLDPCYNSWMVSYSPINRQSLSVNIKYRWIIATWENRKKNKQPHVIYIQQPPQNQNLGMQPPQNQSQQQYAQQFPDQQPHPASGPQPREGDYSLPTYNESQATGQSLERRPQEGKI